MSVTSSTLLRVLSVFLMVRAIENASGVIMALWLNADLPAPPLGVTTVSLAIPIFISVLLWFLAPILGAIIDSSVKRPQRLAHGDSGAAKVVPLDTTRREPATSGS